MYNVVDKMMVLVPVLLTASALFVTYGQFIYTRFPKGNGKHWDYFQDWHFVTTIYRLPASLAYIKRCLVNVKSSPDTNPFLKQISSDLGKNGPLGCTVSPL